ncbi:MAG: transporter substrate-binding domain-containing protein [Lachnospiraceae bacterium]
MKAQIIKKITTGLTLTAVTASLLSGCATQNGSAATDTTQADATESATESATDTTSKDPVLPDSIVIGCMPDWAPFDYVDADGNITGFDVAVTLEACRRLGIEGKFEAYEWAALLPALESGRVQMVAAQIYRSDEREEKFYFSNAPYYKNDNYMVVRADEPAESVQDVIDEGLTFTCEAGELYEQFLIDNNIKFVYFEGNPQTSIENVLAGHSDGFLAVWDTVDNILKETGKEGSLKHIGEPLASDYVYSVFRKNDEGEALAKAFSEVYLEMEADGTLTKLSEEYLSGLPVEGLENGVR